MTQVIDVNTALEALATTRRAEQEAKIAVSAMEKEFEARPDYQAAKANRIQLQAAAVELEKAVRSHALGDFAAAPEPNKHPSPYVEIKIVGRLSYDEQTARAYCLENLKPALKLDRLVFESMAKTGNVPENVVTLIDEPQAFIARDLSPLLTQEQKENPT